MTTDEQTAKYVTQRVVQSPCERCGRAIEQPRRGRLRRYCDRSCRQRAYEERAAGVRLQRDVDAGRIRAEPAERVIERTVQTRPRYPRHVPGWLDMLDELDRQAAAGELSTWRYDELRERLERLAETIGTAYATTVAAYSSTGPHPAGVAQRDRDVASGSPAVLTAASAGAATYLEAVPDGPAAEAIEAVTGHVLRALPRDAAAPWSTTLGRLAQGAGVDVDGARAVLGLLVDGGYVSAERADAAADLERLGEHQRVTIRRGPAAPVRPPNRH